MRRWWITLDYRTMVCLVFTAITVLTSVMMVAGWDEPKTGTLAYVHLLSRLAIIAAVVALFYLDDLWAWIRQRRGVERRVLERSVGGVRAARLDAAVTGFAYAFTLLTVAGCLIAIALSSITDVTGGPGLYRNLLLLAGVLTAVSVLRDILRQARSAEG